jgi:predicted RNase H-like HicB family nuclease
MFKAAAIAVGFVLVTQAAVADDAAKVVGIWKLVSFEVEFQDGSPRRPAYGARPTGYIIFTAQGRMMTVIEGEGRKVAGTDEERAALLRTMFAYTQAVSSSEGHMRYAVVIEKAEGNYSAYVPDLPGCVATGATVAEVESEIREAITFHLEGMREDGDIVPAPSSQVEYVELEA